MNRRAAMRRPGTAALLAASVALAACGGSSKTIDPHALVTQAAATLDAAAGLHFDLTSTGAPTSGTVLVGGSGDVARPDGFRGSLQVKRSGLQFSVEVISVGGVVYLKPPFVTSYAKTDPHKYGFSDPGKLLDPQTGISRLLAAITSTRAAGHDRFRGEVLDEVDVTLPGSAVEQVLTSADPARPVTGKLGLAGTQHQLRRAVLTGPFLSKDVTTTFTIVLDHYGDHPAIRAPS